MLDNRFPIKVSNLSFHFKIFIFRQQILNLNELNNYVINIYRR